MDGPAFRCWAPLMHRQSETLYEDAMIAAIANVADFSRFELPLFNPFSPEGSQG